MFDDIIGSGYCGEKAMGSEKCCDGNGGCECEPVIESLPFNEPCDNSCENEAGCKSSCSGCAGTSKP